MTSIPTIVSQGESNLIPGQYRLIPDMQTLASDCLLVLSEPLCARVAATLAEGTTPVRLLELGPGTPEGGVKQLIAYLDKDNRWAWCGIHLPISWNDPEISK